MNHIDIYRERIRKIASERWRRVDISVHKRILAYGDTLMEDEKNYHLSILDNDIERQEEQIKIHTHLIEDYEQSPKEWHRGRVQSAKDNITYLKEQRNLIANEK